MNQNNSSSLDNLNEKQLEKMIAYKEHQEKSKSMPESQNKYSEQYKRTPIDIVRNALHGGLSGLEKTGETLGNIATLGNLEKIPGYDKYLPWLRQGIESLKPQNASPTGDFVDRASETAAKLIGPGFAFRQIPRAVETAHAIRQAIPLIRNTRLPYQQFTQAVEDTGATARIDPALLRDVEAFHEGTPYQSGRLTQRAAEGDIASIRKLKQDLGAIKRSWRTPEGRDIPAGRLESDLAEALARALREGDNPELADMRRAADTGFAGTARVKEGIASTAHGIKKVGGIIGILKTILSGH